MTIADLYKRLGAMTDAGLVAPSATIYLNGGHPCLHMACDGRDGQRISISADLSDNIANSGLAFFDELEMTLDRMVERLKKGGK